MIETEDARLKRLIMRSSRRGIKEMDLLLGSFARARLYAMDEQMLLLYDSLLLECDHDLLAWMLDQAAPPDHFANLITEIESFVRSQWKAE